MARMTGSWLSGPAAALPDGDHEQQAYQGEYLGLPKVGPGSLAPTPRRVAALAIDWLMSMGVSALFLGGSVAGGNLSTLTLGVWFLLGFVSLSLFSFTPGQFCMGMQVARIDAPGRVGVVRALVRQVFIAFVVPAVITDIDSRGMHDRATGTALLMSR
ncbi:RDD family protein [Rhodococcus sp. BP-149]|uniref:RDD family protein n=1 Tax=unclassified Rhodococcus (in: high G+C Gram-positive bacteria) TaxID=192944 RepID=UPI001C9AD096|nr:MULTISPECIES: RDD family protein [unclassified Rhodococcus (in: high G+C Gram-positive bacteria)]MBY6686078.1 RDD family protein [Rhodococcus sp. BP-288]MBY6696149.1 RDD family protein [Rhodococcus sp. BP-188]MBY6700746.1 RDD family protein [Rhodococcus sp. BP-285]MBY6703250.1 RDD family protein [Rhodococcus sp. BP-283]MBY6711170.1 RDD family protein [Rhodococcus sp. BP-160]